MRDVNTAQLAIVSASAILLAFILAAWSLAYFRGWRIIAPASNGKKVPQGTTNAVAGVGEGEGTVSPSAESVTPAAVPVRRAS